MKTILLKHIKSIVLHIKIPRQLMFDKINRKFIPKQVTKETTGRNMVFDFEEMLVQINEALTKKFLLKKILSHIKLPR